MRILSFILLITAGFMSHPIAAREVAGVEIPELAQASDGDTRLFLNGAGLVERFFHDIYVGALYLEQRQNDAGQVIRLPGAKRISMHFLYEKIEADDLLNAWEEGIRDNVAQAELPELHAHLRLARSYFRHVYRGDVVELDFVPKVGTKIRINGRYQGTIPGSKFYTALLKVWVGERPTDESLKRSLLGSVG